MSAHEGFVSYDLYTYIKVLRSRNPLLISEFTMEEGYQCKEIGDRIWKVLSLEK
jgi:hypothetical protein